MVGENHIDLSIAREQMLQHILQIEDLAALQERKRIARDIHDSLGNALTSLNIQLQTAHKLWSLDPTLAEKFLAEAQRLGAIAIQEVRQSVSNMREIVPLEQSLTALIDSLVQNFHQVTGILPSTKINLPASLSTEVVKTLYRIIQESLTNVCKYARATKVEITLTHTSDTLSLTIQDNGKGFKLSQKKAGFGLQGMQERVLALKGNFKIDTEPGYGCRIVVNIPLEQQKAWEPPTAEEDSSVGNIDPTPPANTTTTDFDLENADTIFIEETSTTEFKLENADSIFIEETATTEFSLQNADTIPPQETSAIDFDLENDDITPLEEITAIQFNLKLIDATLQQHQSAHNFNLKLLEKLPLEEKAEQDFNLKLLEKLPLEQKTEQDFNLKLLDPTLLEENTEKNLNLKLPDLTLLEETNKQSFDLEQKPIFPVKETAAEKYNNPNSSPLDNDFISHFGHNLSELIGPIAYYLVQKVLQSHPLISPLELIKTVALEITDPKKAVSAFTYQEIVDKLSVQLAPAKQTASKQKSSFHKSESLSPPQVKSISENLSISSQNLNDQAISESFVRQCQLDLAEFIGPIATFLVQKAIKSSLNISRAELIKKLAAEIPDSSQALQFQQRLRSESLKLL
ncbi:MAG: sensor histidine kinase [Aulosira sp. ZfuVER01]|nr:sensor histidine kinase [Aulosira sp. ZfuVER01]MDZ8000803.1 sensor histidine kinase [Aulosira sp. DedVER01a]MDZ8055112.1 sensor histidine kinase [Aulosira sp. ZfuCHP01]